ncbi:MAG: DUF2378 family protein [Archangiaceae bacterium]|nr:DUF2378 family protein [Archangiaceae bacterium]
MNTAPATLQEPAFFGPAFEALYLQGLRDEVTPRLRRQLAALGLDLSRPLHAAYSFDTWLRCLECTAETLFPELERSEGIARLGLAFLDGFRDTLIGRAVFQTSRLIGVERTLLRMDRNARTTNNLYRSTSERLSPGHVRLTSFVDDDFVGRVSDARLAPVHFQRGIVRGIVEELTGRTPRLELEVVDPRRHHVVLDVRWSLTS